MPSLIESILSLEQRATSVIAEAHTSAQTIERNAESDIVTARAHLANETNARIETLKSETLERQRQEESAVRAEFDAASAVIARISPDVIRTFAQRVVARFMQG